MNKLVCKFLPKVRGYNGTKVYKTRVDLVVYINSNEYTEIFVELFNSLDMKLNYKIIRKFYPIEKRKFT